jgi:hypothetical protein
MAGITYMTMKDRVVDSFLGFLEIIKFYRAHDIGSSRQFDDSCLIRNLKIRIKIDSGNGEHFG